MKDELNYFKDKFEKNEEIKLGKKNFQKEQILNYVFKVKMEV